ncbi:toxin-activating lysine-acyltransferase [Thaumasiovibrio subtropicus]|uniref:toxin-activating lysine-acyltransferase n=1 Tax=Thaumasiovibrio subtropicus TaxID=1891207 RepID=UPI001C8417D7
MYTRKKRAIISVRSVVKWLEPAVNHCQYLLLKGPYDRYDTGYVTWAWVDETTLKSYESDDRFYPHDSCWNEGNNLIILDVCIPFDLKFHLKKLFKLKKKIFENDINSVSYILRDSKGKVTWCKKWTKN